MKGVVMDYTPRCDYCYRRSVAAITLQQGLIRALLGLPERTRYVCAKCFRRRGLRR